MANEFKIKKGLIVDGDSTFSGSLESTQAVTASFFTGSFSGDGTNLTGIAAEWDGSRNGDAEITGSLTISGSSADLTVTGNVGIGNNSPDEKLHVSGNAKASNIYIADSIIHTGDVDTKIDFSTDSIGFDTAGSERMNISSTGDVGIGTTSPTQKLHVHGNFLLENNNEIRQKDSGGTERTIIELDSSDDLNIGGSYSGALKFIGGGSYTERMRIHDTGNIGIQTTAPAHKLDIYSNENVPLRVHRPSNANLDSSGAWGIGFSTRGDAATSTSDTRAGIFSYYNGNLFLAANTSRIDTAPSASARLTVLNTGNIGIGTMDPDSRLEVDMGDASGNRLGFTGDGSTTGAALWTNWTTGNSHLDFRLGGTNDTYTKMRITSGGNVGIGTTSPAAKLHVYNGEAIVATSTDGLKLSYSVGNSSGIIDTAFSDNNLEFRTNGTTKMWIANGGNVGIGTTSPGVELDVTGQIRASSGLEISGGNINLVDNSKIRLGAAADLQMYHDGSHSYITNSQGSLYLRSNNSIQLEDTAGNNMLVATDGGAIELYHNANKKFETTSTGVSVTGDLSLTDLTVSGTASIAYIDVQFVSSSIIYSSGSNIFGDADDDVQTFNGDMVVNDTDLFVDASTGNVGIGTTSPSQKLEVNGGSLLVNSATGREATLTGFELRFSRDSVNYLYATDSAGSIRIVTGGNIQGSAPTADFKSNRDSIFYGKVGIGTSSPLDLLHLESTTGDVRQLLNAPTDSDAEIKFAENGTVKYTIGHDAASDNFVIGTTNVDTQQRLVIDSSGNVGIGTTSPDNILHIVKDQGGAASALKLENKAGANNSGFDIDFQLATSGLSAKIGAIRTNSPGAGDTDIFFSTSTDGSTTAERMRIAHDGNVGIGTSSPEERLHIADSDDVNIYLESTDTTVIAGQSYGGLIWKSNDGSGIGARDTGRIQLVSSGNVAESDMLFSTTDYNVAMSEKMRITSTGNVGIGTETPAEKLTVEGNISGSGDVNIVGDITASAFVGDGSALTGITATDSTKLPLAGGTMTGNLKLNDSIRTYFGSDNDSEILHNGSDMSIQNFTGDLKLTNYADDKDIIFSTDDGSGNTTEYFRLDGSATNMKAFKNIRFMGSVDAEFGTGGDLKIYHDGSNSYIEQINSGTGDIILAQNVDDGDIIFQSDDGSGGTTEYFKLDGTNTRVLYSKPINIVDDNVLQIGNSQDLRLFHDGNNSYITQQGTGDLIIQQHIDDADIRFQSDDGSGNTAEYFRLDGGLVNTVISKDFRFEDNVKSTFGSSQDLEIYHDGSNSYITDTGTGDLYIRGSNSVYIGNNAGTKTYISGTDGGATKLYYNGAGAQQKLETTSTGINVTGSLTVTGDGYSESSWGVGTDVTPVGKIRNNSGIFDIMAEGARQISLSNVTNGELIRINATGNVGIGQTSPTARLQVKGSGATSATTALLVENSSGTDLLKVTDDGLVTIPSALEHDGDPGTGLHFPSDDAISLKINGTEALHIKNNRFVGIGTTTPEEELHVAGDLKVEGDLYLEGDIGFRVINSSGFGQPGIELPNFVDTFWRADRRFTLSVTGGQSVAAVGNLFNGAYGNLVNFAANTTHTITINVAGQSGVGANGFTYPQGYIYFSFYSSTNDYDSISGRVKDNNGTYYNMSGLTDIISNDPTYKVMRLTVPINNNIVEYELTLVTNTNNVRLAAINYVSTRHTDQMELPYLAKTLDTNRLFGNIDILTNASADQNRISGTGDSYFAVSTGDVGIGTSTPAEKLTVSGDANVTGKFAVGNAAAHGTYDFYNQSTAYFNGAVTIDDTITQTGGGTSTFSGDVEIAGGVTGSSFTGSFVGDGSGLTGVGGGTPGGSNKEVQFNDGGAFGGNSNFVFDDTNTRLGINTATPSHTLEINGDFKVDSSLIESFSATALTSGVHIVAALDSTTHARVGMFVDYTIYETTGNSTRAGRVMIASNGTSITSTDNSTADIGNTTGAIWSAVINTSSIDVTLTVPATGTWDVIVHVTSM